MAKKTTTKKKAAKTSIRSGPVTGTRLRTIAAVRSEKSLILQVASQKFRDRIDDALRDLAHEINSLDPSDREARGYIGPEFVAARLAPFTIYERTGIDFNGVELDTLIRQMLPKEEGDFLGHHIDLQDGRRIQRQKCYAVLKFFTDAPAQRLQSEIIRILRLLNDRASALQIDRWMGAVGATAWESTGESFTIQFDGMLELRLGWYGGSTATAEKPHA